MSNPVGQARSHESAIAHVTGGAIYTDEQRPLLGMLSLWPVLAPHAHARIRQIDLTAVLALKGVITVLTAADVPGDNNTGVILADEVLLPTEEVSYWGQAVAWVVATTEVVAQQAAQRVVVDYEPLEAIVTLHQAIAAQRFQGQPQVVQRGDAATALTQAECALQGELELNGQDHFYLETHTSWVIPDGQGHYQVYASTQHPSETQHTVARVLGIPSHRVVVTCLRMGGAFGGKETQANPFAAIAAIAAHKTGQPVRLKLKRQHDMLLTGKRHGYLAQYHVGFSRQGDLSALDVQLYSDGGWSLDLSPPVMLRSLVHVDNAYYIPHLTVQGRIAQTHKASNTAMRGFGAPQAMVVIEEILDRVARSLQLPPDWVRERNFYHGSGASNTTHYGQDLVDNRILRVWSQVKTQASFAERVLSTDEFNRHSPYRKRGLAITPVKFGISFNKTPYNQAGALVLIYTDGSIQLNHGGTEMGQGLHTKMLQVAAQALGVRVDRIRIMPTSTDKVPNTSATAASSGSDLNGQAIYQACETLKARLAPVAAKLLQLDAPEDLVFDQDWIYCASYPSARIPFEQVVQQAYLDRVTLSATGFYRTPNLYWDAAKGQGRPFYYFAYGAAVSEVEVDGWTGQFQLRQVNIVHDVGQSLNPLVDRGQIEGGFVQGLGWLTMEELVWDGSGRLRSDAPSTYKIPTIAEIPQDFQVELLERAAQEGVIYGSKAVGEPPFMLAISVREAIRAAVAAFAQSSNPPTFVPLASPATPEAILRAIQGLQVSPQEMP
jgi:xanthine dehydrogenase large subunit